jgi:hypothetical protein
MVKLPYGLELTSNSSYIGRTSVNANVSSLYLPGTAPVSTSGTEPLPELGFNALNFGAGSGQFAAVVAAFNTTYSGSKNATGAAIPQLVSPASYQLGDTTTTSTSRCRNLRCEGTL